MSHEYIDMPEEDRDVIPRCKTELVTSVQLVSSGQLVKTDCA